MLSKTVKVKWHQHKFGESPCIHIRISMYNIITTCCCPNHAEYVFFSISFPESKPFVQLIMIHRGETIAKENINCQHTVRVV